MEENHSILQLQQGDISGLEFLVRKYYLQAVRAAFLVVRDQNLAEDIVQTCFMNLTEKIGQFDSSKRFGPWFLRSVINFSITACRRNSRFVSLDNENGADLTVTILDGLISPQSGPEENMITEETRQMVWDALGQLNAQQRAVVVMRYYLEFSEKEITEELKRPLSSIKWLLYSAREHLRRLLRSLESNEKTPEPIKREEIR